MKLIQVRNKRLERDFLRLPHLLYKQDPEWVPHLEEDVKAVFNPLKNGYFRHGEARRWVLYEAKRGKPIGRIAAFMDHAASVRSVTKAGGIGFFECIQNEKAAFTLFDACRDWLLRKGMEGMDGPVNFGERDRFWGLMVEGFKNPSYLENYNPPHYRDFFEAYGFREFFEQTTSEVTLKAFNYERFKPIARRVTSKPEYSFVQFDRKQLDKFVEDFCEIYNAAWDRHINFNPLSTQTTKTIFKNMLPVIKDEFIWFAYARGEPAGFFVNILEANEIFRHVNGKLNLFNKLRFLYHRYIHKPKRLKGIVFGIKPQFQNLGLESGMIVNIYERVKAHPSVEVFELAWVGDFNPKMQSLLKALGCHSTKTHITYRKLFSDTETFKRYELKKFV